ncbi:MAG TPA: hypothetical protein ENJ68_06055 [Devosia sp.]|nr:hypothetical protein [Devosia sp.]
MGFLLRIIGTWLLGIVLIFIVMDGTKSLAASQLVMTSVREVWAIIHGSSLMGLEQAVGNGKAGSLLKDVVEAALGWPAWAVAAVPGLALVILGQGRNRHANRHRY